jgi:hypothetical protein
LLTPLLTEKVYSRSADFDQEIQSFRYDFLIEVGDPLRKLQMHSVSNAVSSAEKFERTSANLNGQKVLPFGEIWTSESGGEQEIWA